MIALGGIPSKVQVGDMAVDGRIFPVRTNPTDTESMFADDWFPVQVKQTPEVTQRILPRIFLTLNLRQDTVSTSI